MSTNTANTATNTVAVVAPVETTITTKIYAVDVKPIESREGNWYNAAYIRVNNPVHFINEHGEDDTRKLLLMPFNKVVDQIGQCELIVAVFARENQPYMKDDLGAIINGCTIEVNQILYKAGSIIKEEEDKGAIAQDTYRYEILDINIDQKTLNRLEAACENRFKHY